MLRFAQILQLIVSVIITLLVLMQTKGKGLSSFLGGDGGFYSTRRGLEKIIFVVTIILGILLTANSLFMIYLS
ncbi:MAG: preprotein translocase subunit SecG [Patescibacteria group bacterium]